MSPEFNHRLSISVIVPVYNSIATIPELLRRLCHTLNDCTEKFEVICVVDHPDERIWNILTRLAKQYPTILRGIRLTRNSGQHQATLCGIRAARYPLFLTIDEDLQQWPEDIPLLLGALTADTDVVYAIPRLRRYAPLYHALGWLARRLFYLLWPNPAILSWSPYRLCRTRVRDGFMNFPYSRFCLDVLLTRNSNKIRHVSVTFHRRERGKSGYRFRGRVELALSSFALSETLFRWKFSRFLRKNHSPYEICESF